MKEQRFSAGLISKLKNIVKTSVTLGLMCSFAIIAIGGSFAACYGLFQLILAITAIVECIQSVSFKLSKTGITVESPLRHETFRFDRYNVFRTCTKGKYSLHFVSFDGKRSVYIKCRSFTTAQFNSLMSNIKLYRGTDCEVEADPVDAKPDKSAYEPPKAAAKREAKESVKQKSTEKPRTVESPKTSEPIVFRYPSRSVIDDTERKTVLIVLVLLLACVTTLLLFALTSKTVLLTDIVVILIVFAVIIAIVLLTRIPKTKNLPSKLEVDDDYFMIDNDRYRFSKIKDGRMTSSEASAGMRRISFEYGDKQVVCCLGPAKKPSKNKRADEYMDRYGELCRLLAKRNFK